MNITVVSPRRSALGPLAFAGLVGALVACSPESFHGMASVTGAAGDPTGGAGTAGPSDAADAAPADAAAGNGGGGMTALAGAGGNVDATGAAGLGAAGAGLAGLGAAGVGAAGVGAAGAGAAGHAAAGASGQAGQGGKAGAGGPDAGTDAPAACNCMLKIVYECRQDGPSIGLAEYSIKVVNTGTTSIALSAVTVRYWYTLDGTGGQSGMCTSATHPCTLAFQNATPTTTTADESAVISFGAGTLAAGTDTGEIQVQMEGTGTYNQTNDYSFASTGANFIDAPHITAYVSGKLAWGTAP
jgi:cellulose 1,4-beta-cellobiosidase